MTILLLLIVLAAPCPPVHLVPWGAAQEAPAALRGRERVWEAPIGRLAGTTLVDVGLVGNLLLVHDSAHGVSALDPATGAIRWFVRLPGRLDHWPSLGDGALVLSASTDLVTVDSRTGRRLRTVSTASIPAGSPVSDGGMLYTPSLLGDRLVGIDLANGLTAWEFRMRAPLSGPALLLGDGARRSVLVACDDGTLHAVPGGRAAPETERWVARVGALVGAPVAAGGRLLVATTDRSVLALDAGTGAAAWRHLPGEPLTGKPVPGGDLVFVGTPTRVLALDGATGALRWERSQPDQPLASSAGLVLVARSGGSALLDAADGHDVAIDLPRDVLLVDGLFIELRQETSLVAMRLLR